MHDFEQGRPQRIKRWQGIVGAIVGGFLAQVAGIVAAVLAVAWTAASFGSRDMQAVLRVALSGLAFPVASVVLAGGAMVLVAVATPLLAKVPVRAALGLRRPRWLALAGAIVGALGLIPIDSVAHRLVKALVPSWTFGSVELLNGIAKDHSVLIVWPLLALVPSVSEELMFRGLLQRSLGRTHWAMVVSALAFAAFHLDPHHVAAMIPAGAYLAWLGARTDSTVAPMLAHMTNNTVAVVLARVAAAEPASAESEEMPFWILAPAMVLVAGGAAMVYHGTRRPRTEAA